MRSDCMRCVYSQFTEQAIVYKPINERRWPDDFECVMGCGDFPTLAHVCIEYVEMGGVYDDGPAMYDASEQRVL